MSREIPARVSAMVGEMDAARERLGLSVGETLAVLGVLTDGFMRYAPELIREELRRAMRAAVDGDPSAALALATRGERLAR